MFGLSRASSSLMFMKKNCLQHNLSTIGKIPYRVECEFASTIHNLADELCSLVQSTMNNGLTSFFIMISNYHDANNVGPGKKTECASGYVMTWTRFQMKMESNITNTEVDGV